MRAGTLRHRVTIQRSTPGRGELGERIERWSDLLECWAAIRTIDGDKQIGAEAESISITHIITLRYQRALDDICLQDRVTANGNPYKIQRIINVGERDIALDLHCTQLTRDET